MSIAIIAIIAIIAVVIVVVVAVVGVVVLLTVPANRVVADILAVARHST